MCTIIIDNFCLSSIPDSIVCSDNALEFSLYANQENIDLIKEWIAKGEISICLERWACWKIDQYIIDSTVTNALTSSFREEIDEATGATLVIADLKFNKCSDIEGL